MALAERLKSGFDNQISGPQTFIVLWQVHIVDLINGFVLITLYFNL